MGLLDSLTQIAGGAGNNNAGLLPVVLNQLANYPGGIAGLIESFQRGGLGEIVQSWISPGQNEPVTANQLDAVLDPGVVDNIAQESGQDRGSVLESLTSLLPQIVDQATPDGSADNAQPFNASAVLGSLGKLFG
ncbi:YidB family protein [Bordetella sp. 2513F-2]